MFKKILIANRGEIAMRIVRACAEMGIRSVAIYADADRNALHVKKADEACRLGEEPLSGYLNPHRVVAAARAFGCDAVHPGYGFLSENPALAELCGRRGIRFIGPSAAIIAQMGDKIQARRAMQKAGIPVIPGSDQSLPDAKTAETLADKVGYPVMLKATNGGGGRGIRRCESADDIRRHFPRIQSEAEKAFGKPDIFLEKCIVRPRHIEVQILADSHGNIVHLFERDCSIQRRNQKLIEIAPSPQLSTEERAEVCGYAVTAARSAGYENAGTVEFLQDRGGKFYFMEMNTRLQVEHTVSEQITGQDIVQEQIRIAAGNELSVWQGAISHRGYAMEMRINAENPKNNFLPSFGRVTKYYAPGGPGVRVDGAIYTGYVIPPYYDSMCAKLTVWALSWPSAIHRALRALDDMQVSGIKTTIPFYRRILSDPDFCSGVFDTGYLDDHPNLIDYKEKIPREDTALAIAAAIAAHLESPPAQEAQ